MADARFVPLRGSGHAALPIVGVAGAVDPSEQIEVTLITRRRAPLPHQADVPARLTRQELSEWHGTDPAEQQLVGDVLSRFGLTVTSHGPGTRQMTVIGTAAAFSVAFGAELAMVTSRHPSGAGVVQHRYWLGGLRIPAELDGTVEAVLGLDTRPQARAHARRADHAAVRASYTPSQVASIYGFPAGVDGSGETLAIIELGGGFSHDDLDPYFSGLGIASPSVTAVGVDGASNVPGRDPPGADAQVLLDIEVAGAVAPGATQVVYFAPNTDKGFFSALTSAVNATPTPTAVTIGWGRSEDGWTGQAMYALDQVLADAAALGITVCVAAGSSESRDELTDESSHVDFPASSPHVLACGGTSLYADPATGVITSESVWNKGSSGYATGGGVSDVFALPSWQASSQVPLSPSGVTGRGVPDVAGNADPATGYQVLVDGQRTVVGGTSAVAALWSALICRMAQVTGESFGMIQQQLHAFVSVGGPILGFHNITTGNNGAYAAGPGWDACTGLGSPDGSALLAALTALVPGDSAIADSPPPAAEPEHVPGSSEFDRIGSPSPLPLQSRPVVYDELVRRAFAEMVQPGRLLFNPPDRMRLGDTERVEVRMARALELDAELLADLRGHGKPQLEDIQTAPLMAVTLRGEGFRITAHSDEEQSVTNDGITTWEFDIRALQRGHQQLIMSVSLRIPVPGQLSQRKSIPVREATIDVQVGAPALVGAFVAGNWQWFIGTAIAIAAVVIAVLYH